MTKKKIGKNKKMKSARSSGNVVPKIVEKEENKQLFWFFVGIIVLFAAFFIPYLYIQSQKYFEFDHIKWDIDKDGDFRGQFKTFNNENNTHNIFLRTDPRLNDVNVEGKLDSFTYKVIVSFDRNFDMCRGEMARISADFGDFLINGVGASSIGIGVNDVDLALEKNLTFANCKTNKLTVITVNINGESKIVRAVDDPDCYNIYLKDCNDISTFEKFMSRAVNDFYEKRLANGK